MVGLLEGGSESILEKNDLRFAAVGHRKKTHIMYTSNSSPGHVSSTKGEVVPPLSTFFGDQNGQRLDQLNVSQAVLKENPQKTTKNPQANCMSLDTNLVALIPFLHPALVSATRAESL